MMAMNSERHETTREIPYSTVFARDPPAALVPGATVPVVNEEDLFTDPPPIPGMP